MRLDGRIAAVALNGGYHVSLLVGAVFVVVAASVAAAVLRVASSHAHGALATAETLAMRKLARTRL